MRNGIIFYIIIFALIFAFWKFFRDRNLHIKLNTFFKKGFLVDNGAWGVYCYVGKQGSGKTYSVVEFLNEHKKDSVIFSNVSKLSNLEYIYIPTFDDLLNTDYSLYKDKQVIIFYDEIFSALTRTSRMSSEVLAFLSQMRKRKIIFLTTAQEWLEINITLRRYVRFQIDCSIHNFFGRSYLLKVFHDGDLIHWDRFENDYISPILETTISKMQLNIANSYDTYEVINSSTPQKKERSTQQHIVLPSDLLNPIITHNKE